MNARALKTLALSAVMLATAPVLAQSYHSYEGIGTFLQGVADDHPDITRYYDLGSSVLGRSIRAIQIGDNPDLEEDEPEFRYISTIHGDEILGVEMCLYFVDDLTDNYGSDPDLTALVDGIDIWIVPLMNPDGFVSGSRYNAHGQDLNRDFPDPWYLPDNTIVGREPETAVIMEWTWDHTFTLCCNFHGGAKVVNYPYDNNETGSSVYTASPDDDLFIWISEEYSQHNLPMWTSPYFYHGITNGAAWYAITGGLQDWGYRYEGINAVTIELDEDKSPPASELPTFWNDNRESMVAYMQTCLIGVRGIVTDADTGAPLAATVTVVNRDHAIHTDPDVGDYHRMLLPGSYDLMFEAPGYDPLTIVGVVVDSGDATRLDVSLPSPPPEITAPNGGETLTVGVATDVTWTGGAADPFQVQYTDNYGETGVTTDSFEDGILGPQYATGGAANWYVSTQQPHLGAYSARGGAIGDNQTTWMTRSVGGGSAVFWYRVSSEAHYDFFNFYVDGALKIQESGSTGWRPYSTTLPAGTHVLKWEYVKDQSVSSGSDTVWIDDLQITADATAWNDIVAMTDPGESSVPWTPPAEGVDYKVRVRAVYDAGFSVWDESDGVFTVQAVQLVGDIDGDCDVDLSDLAELLARYGACSGDPQYLMAADLDASGCINISDLAALLAHYGESCP